MDNRILASAIALALGTAGVAHAAGTCDAPDYVLYAAGSSAAKAAFATALAADLFSAETTYSSSNGDFDAYCGPISSGGATATGLTAGNVAVVHYRAEGGSVMGALPIVAGDPVKFLDLTGTGCNVAIPPTTGTSSVNGSDDSWGGCLTTHEVEMGVTDLEPGVFYADSIVSNYPTAYSVAAFGSASKTQLQGLSATPLFSQTFGIFVNNLSLSGTINLSKETVGKILSGGYKNWSQVPTATGAAVTGSSLPIVIKNREAGSGTRAGASIYFLGQECGLGVTLKDGAASLDAYATSDALKFAASVAGAITYAGIDNNGKQSNLTMVQLSGVTPSNLASAAGQYDYWYEATGVLGNTSGTSGGITSPGGNTIATWLMGGELQNLASAPHAAQINVIPNAGTNGAGVVPITSSTVGGKTIYLNPFTRFGNSCKNPG
jgi:ABC-type phosphate transport system substrate-binding protein